MVLNSSSVLPFTFTWLQSYDLDDRFEEPKDRSLSLFREASFGHGRLRIINETQAHWSWHRNEDEFSNVADEILIENLGTPNHDNNVARDIMQPRITRDEL